MQNSANESGKQNLIFSLKEKNFSELKMQKLSTCFSQMLSFSILILKSAFEASTFCPFCTVNAAAIFNQSAQDWQAVIRLIL